MQIINLNKYISVDNYGTIQEQFLIEREKYRKKRVEELNEQLNDTNYETILDLTKEETELLITRLGLYNNGKQVTYKKLSEIFKITQSQIIGRLGKIYKKIGKQIKMTQLEIKKMLNENQTKTKKIIKMSKK